MQRSPALPYPAPISCVHGLIQVRVGHHDLYGSWHRAETLRPLAGGGGTSVDVLSDIRADEADGLDVRVVQDGVDGLLVAVPPGTRRRQARLDRARPASPEPNGSRSLGLSTKGVAAR